MQLQFDYWPILRSMNKIKPELLDGTLQDLIDTYWNDEECWPTVELSKEQIEKGSITRITDISIKEQNRIALTGKQIFETDKFIKQTAAIDIVKVSSDEWQINYNMMFDHSHDELSFFDDKFGIGNESFHFKLNGEALIVNEVIKANKPYKAEKTIKWEGNTPLMFEMEEYGYGNNPLNRFIQGVRWTIK